MRDELARLEGIGEIAVFGAREYSMRIWLDPDKMAVRNITASDVIAALRRQNVQVASGVIGGEPIPNPSSFELVVESPGRLVEADAFADVVIRSSAEGGLIRVRDIGRVELGAQDYVTDATLSGKPAVAIAIFQRPGSNALATAEGVIEKMKELERSFPAGIGYTIVYNPTEFVETSIEKVVDTLFEAVILVVLVVFVFLQSVRAAIIPILAIPVSIVGTFAVIGFLGGSINTLSLFGLILAIGIVVDDAIVVVENVERNLAAGMSPKEAARKSMDEVGGALIAIALTLIAVFAPVGFIPGIAGRFYGQFALTIATATAISAFVSLTLSPALCAAFLRPHAHHPKEPKPWERPLLAFFRRFNQGFDWLSSRYGRVTKSLVRRTAIVGLVYVGLLALTVFEFRAAPQGFIPQMDRGYAFVAVQLPPGSSLQRTREVLAQVDQRLSEVEGVAERPGFAGFSGATGVNASNTGTIFFTFDPFEERVGKGLSGDRIINDVRAALSPIQEAFILVIAPPAVRGIGTGSGVKMWIQDRGDNGYGALAQAATAMMMAANQTPGVGGAFTLYEARTPRLKLEIDRDKAESQQVPVSEVNQALETFLGSTFVNDFNFLGRTYRVTAQADGPFREDPENIGRIFVRNLEGQLLPLASVVNFSETAGPQRVPRYNLYAAADLNAEPAPGTSSGQLIAALEELAERELPAGFDYEWTELAYLQKEEGGGALGVFLLAALFVFLVLAAQYESLTLPLAVILITPMALLGALAGVFARGLDVNILTQVAFIVLVGLAAKNAILIVEFAKQLEDQGKSAREAAAEAASLRLRPILMTSFAFILGVVPLVTATGAGAEQRIAIGTAVFAGMIGVTLLGLLFTPAFYVMTRDLSDRLARLRARKAPGEPEPGPAPAE